MSTSTWKSSIFSLERNHWRGVAVDGTARNRFWHTATSALLHISETMHKFGEYNY